MYDKRAFLRKSNLTKNRLLHCILYYKIRVSSAEDTLTII